MTKRSVLLLVAAAILGLVVLGMLGPPGERPQPSIDAGPSESRTDSAGVECRLYVSFQAGDPAMPLSVTLGGPSPEMEASEMWIYVTVSEGTDAIVLSEATGCPSAGPTAVPRDRT